MQYKCQLPFLAGWINSAPHHLEREKSDVSVKFLEALRTGDQRAVADKLAEWAEGEERE